VFSADGADITGYPDTQKMNVDLYLTPYTKWIRIKIKILAKTKKP